MTIDYFYNNRFIANTTRDSWFQSPVTVSPPAIQETLVRTGGYYRMKVEVIGLGTPPPVYASDQATDGVFTN